MDMSSSASKNEKFRIEIRRKQIDQKFSQIRTQLEKQQLFKQLIDKGIINCQSKQSVQQKVESLLHRFELSKKNGNLYMETISINLEKIACKLLQSSSVPFNLKKVIIQNYTHFLVFDNQFLQSKKFQDDQIQQVKLCRMKKLVIGLTDLIQRDFSVDIVCLFVYLLNAFLDQREENPKKDHENIQDMVPKGFLLKIAQKLRDKLSPIGKITIYQLIRAFGKMKNLSEVIYSNQKQQRKFVSFLMKRHIVRNENGKRYLVKLICKIIDQDFSSFTIMMKFQFSNFIRDLFQTNLSSENIESVLELVYRLVSMDKERILLRELSINGIISQIIKLKQSEDDRIRNSSQAFFQALIAQQLIEQLD